MKRTTVIFCDGKNAIKPNDREEWVVFSADGSSEMKEYLKKHGWHFSKKLHDHAVAGMKKRSASGGYIQIQPFTKEEVDAFLKQHKIELDNNEAYDSCYVTNMARSDFYNSSILSESGLAQFVKDYIDDADGYEGLPLARYCADCVSKKEPIPWLEVI